MTGVREYSINLYKDVVYYEMLYISLYMSLYLMAKVTNNKT